jgi:hypothetical protein
MTVLNLIVGASSDDAFQAAPTSTAVINGSSILIDAINEYGGWRFTNVTIAQGATINSATLTLNLTQATNDSPALDIYCEDVDDAATFAAASNNLSNRTLTTAKTDWDGTDLGTGDKIVSITSAVQEVIDRAGWVSGNDLNVIAVGQTGTAVRINTWDNSTSLCARLDIDYTEAGAATSLPPVRRTQTYVRL